MKAADPAFFHKLYGAKKPRIFLGKRDFLDYTLMILLTAVFVGYAYGFGHGMGIAGLALCAFMLVAFILRHGIELTMPVILRRPQDLLYMVVYKFQNLKPMYFAAIGVLLLQNALVAATPGLPHHVELMRNIGFALFYIHFGYITVFRTICLIDHLRKRELAREVLMQTPWKRVINDKTNMVLEFVHAYSTGLLTHIILIAPWYLVIKYSRFSLVFLPVVAAIDVLVHVKWGDEVADWFYRDHWLCHNSELEFVYLHCSHHDVVPCAMIAAAGNGFLEGVFRNVIGFPNPFHYPIISAIAYTSEIKSAMHLHQYIPGIFPNMEKRVLEVVQHATHHYGKLEPYGFGMKLDQPHIGESYKKRFRRIPYMNSFRMEEELTGFQWDNPTYRNTLRLWEKYGKRTRRFWDLFAKGEQAAEPNVATVPPVSAPSAAESPSGLA